MSDEDKNLIRSQQLKDPNESLTLGSNRTPRRCMVMWKPLLTPPSAEKVWVTVGQAIVSLWDGGQLGKDSECPIRAGWMCRASFWIHESSRNKLTVPRPICRETEWTVICCLMLNTYITYTGWGPGTREIGCGASTWTWQTGTIESGWLKITVIEEIVLAAVILQTQPPIPNGTSNSNDQWNLETLPACAWVFLIGCYNGLWTCLQLKVKWSLY